jgi:putative tryptophan/tyrosine transport system substrate-binding protein
MRRRDFIAGIGSTVFPPAVARAQRSALPVVAFVMPALRDTSARYVAAFREGLGEIGYAEGRDVTIEYHWLEGQYDGVPVLMAGLVRSRVAVIVAIGPSAVALAAKAATATIPILFMVSHDPVSDGLVASLGRPGGNATGTNILVQEAAAKRLELLHRLVPNAVCIALLLNPANGQSEALLREVQLAATAIGVQIRVVNASGSREIDEAFETFAQDRPDALFVANDPLFQSLGVQFATLATGNRIPTAYHTREPVLAGGLMSYGIDQAGMFHQTGIYTGRILNGERPADLPVQQATKFEFVLNLKTAKALNLNVTPDVLSIADEVIE